MGDDGTVIQSSCEDTITVALQDLAQELLIFQDEGEEPETGETI